MSILFHCTWHDSKEWLQKFKKRFKDKKIYTYNKYIYFFIGFLILALSEIMVRYSGFSWTHTAIYYLLALGMIPLSYLTLIRKFKYENVI